MRASLLALVLLLGTGSAHAANDDISQFEHHASAGQLEITPRLAEVLATSDVKNPSVQGFDHRYVDDTILHVSAEYGIVPQFAIGVDLGMSTASARLDGGIANDMRTNTSGFDDISIYGRGHFHLPVGSLVYGVDADISTSKHVEDVHGNFNSASGGTSIAPYLGYEVQTKKAGLFGGQVDYLFQNDTKFKDERTTPATESTSSGGNAVGAAFFYEYRLHPITFGAAVVYEHIANTKTGGVSDDDHKSLYGVRLYTPIRLGKIEILPEMDSISYALAGDSPYKNVHSFVFQVAGRFAF